MGSIVCVTKNNLALTKVAIRSALKQDEPCDVVVVENHSSDGTLSWLKTKPVALICPYHEIALAKCWNTALRSIFSTGAAKVLVINNDVELRPDTYRVLSVMVDNGYPFVTCVSVNTREQVGHPNDRGFSELVDGARPHPDFSCFMITRAVVDKVGWFDENYFPAYYEDNDYHVRMHRAGMTAVCVDLPFLHHGAQTVKTATLGERERISRYASANKERFKDKYGCYPGTPEYNKLFVL